MAGFNGDAVVFGECRLKNLRIVDIKKNGEKIGEKTLVDIATWGSEYTAEVDPSYSAQLQFCVTGRAILNCEFDSDKEIRKFDGDTYQKVVYKFSSLRLHSFEVGK